MGNLEFGNFLQTLGGALGTIGQILVFVLEIGIAIALAGFLIYWFGFRRKFFYNIVVNIYEPIGGQVVFSHVEWGGFITNKGGAGTVFKLMPTLRKWRKPMLVNPDLEMIKPDISGNRYVNYLRLGKDVYVPFDLKFKMDGDPRIELARKINIDSIKNQLTANYIKFREEGLWAKYGNQIIVITFGLLMFIGFLIIAKDLAVTAQTISSGSSKLAEAIDAFGKQIVS